MLEWLVLWWHVCNKIKHAKLYRRFSSQGKSKRHSTKTLVPATQCCRTQNSMSCWTWGQVGSCLLYGFSLLIISKTKALSLNSKQNKQFSSCIWFFGLCLPSSSFWFGGMSSRTFVSSSCLPLSANTYTHTVCHGCHCWLPHGNGWNNCIPKSLMMSKPVDHTVYPVNIPTLLWCTSWQLPLQFFL